MVEAVSIFPPTPQSVLRALKKRLIWVMLLRVVLISVLLGATIILNYQTSETFSQPSARFLIALVGGVYVSTILYGIWYRLGKGILALARVQLTFDLVMWACLTYATGGVISAFSALFDLWVIVWAIVLGGRAAFQSALLSSVLVTILGGLMFTGVLTPLSDQTYPEISWKAFVYFLGVNVSALFIVAFLVNSLVSRLERTGRGLEVERTRRADLVQLHADMIRSLTVGIATTDMGKNILTMNPAGLDILGSAYSKVDATPIEDWFPDLKGQLNVASPIRSQGRGVAVGEGSKRVPVEYIVAPLTSANGTNRGYIVVFSDLTEMRKLESALEKSRRLAALGELAASLAHEIRNPLGAMSGAFQILVTNPHLGEEDHSLVTIIRREIARMEQLVTDVLDYSRPQKPRMSRVNLSDLIQDVIRTFLMDEDARDRLVHVEVKPELYHTVNGQHIRQILWNLLRNALQATIPGQQISVHAEKQNSTLTLEVIDTGSGIDDVDISQIFDPFFTTRERGLGLGLALCRRMVTEHQGEISAEVRNGVGTVFQIKIPEIYD